MREPFRAKDFVHAGHQNRGFFHHVISENVTRPVFTRQSLRKITIAADTRQPQFPTHHTIHEIAREFASHRLYHVRVFVVGFGVISEITYFVALVIHSVAVAIAHGIGAV